jgi:undecaprenyl-diphosphatase
MITLIQATIFGLLQGVTELFPISSLGHSVVLPHALGWKIDQNDPFFLTFLVATHTATALVLFFFFFKDWVRIGKGMLITFKKREIGTNDTDGKLAWLLVVATVPAGILGLLFEEYLKKLFADPQLIAVTLILNGFLLFGAEILRRKKTETYTGDGDKRIAKLSFQQAIKIGMLQCIALIPGFSRTGATMTAGLLIGLSHEDAVRFSFLLATPIIGAASLLKLPDLTLSSTNILIPTLVGAIFSALASFFSVRFLTKYFETKKLTPFGLYCMLLGLGLSILFFFRG